MKFFPKASTYNSTTWDVIHRDIDSPEELGGLDDSMIEKVHAVCMHDGKIIVVKHPQQDVWGLPGGTREEGEPLEETLRREIQEEANCEMLSAVPTSYQEFIDEDGITRSYRVQYFCNVRPLGEFVSDVAGNIVQIAWIDPSELESHIEKKEYRQAIVQRIVNNIEDYKKL